MVESLGNFYRSSSRRKKYPESVKNGAAPQHCVHVLCFHMCLGQRTWRWKKGGAHEPVVPEEQVSRLEVGAHPWGALLQRTLPSSEDFVWDREFCFHYRPTKGKVDLVLASFFYPFLVGKFCCRRRFFYLLVGK